MLNEGNFKDNGPDKIPKLGTYCYSYTSVVSTNEKKSHRKITMKWNQWTLDLYKFHEETEAILNDDWI